MAKQGIGIGSSANDGTGDTLRAGGDKINDNFDEVYAALGNGTALKDIINSSLELDVSTGGNKISFLYSTEGDLPNATTYHGAVAHVHGTGALYYAHGGAWHKVVTDVSNGNVTNYTPPSPTLAYTVNTADGSKYRFTGPGVTSTTDNPNFVCYRGHTYIFDNTSGHSGHPLEIRVSNGGSAFTEGVTSPATGVIKFVVPHEPTDVTLVYQCTVHSSMVGLINIT